MKPTHPRVTSGICGTVIRVAGFVRLASRPGITGVDLHAAELRAVLDTATLTDSEILDGVQAWENYTDPFPEWVLGH